MTRLKDKLSASVRMAKAAQQPAAKSAAKPAARPVAKPATVKSTPVPAKPAATPPPAAAKPAAPRTHAGDISESGSALFPERVWPD